jgi:hypothetical protein
MGCLNAIRAGGRNLVGRLAPLGAHIDVCPKTRRRVVEEGCGVKKARHCEDGVLDTGDEAIQQPGLDCFPALAMTK